MYIYVCIYVYTHTDIHIYIDIHTYIYIYIYICICICIYIYIYIYIYLYTYVQTYVCSLLSQPKRVERGLGVSCRKVWWLDINDVLLSIWTFIIDEGLFS